MNLLQALADASPGAQALVGTAGSLSPAALAVVLLVALPKWSRALSRAVKLLGMLGAVVAGYLLVSNWAEISATLSP